MTNSSSRSTASRSKFLGVLVVLCAILGAGGMAQAGRKRVVVLDFEGPSGDKFHEELVKLIKKTHTVISTDKWNGTAEELDASGVSEKNLKKVAKKLKIDAIVEGKIEKRRDEFIIRLKLHEGRSGELIGNTIDTKAEGPRIDGRAQRDLKDELVDAIDNVESNHLGGSDDDDATPAGKKGAKKTDDDDAAAAADKPAGKKGAKKPDDDDAAAGKKPDKKPDDDDKPGHKGFSKLSDDERGGDKVDKKAAKKADDDDDKLPPKKAAKKADDDDDKLPPKKAAAKKADDDDKLPPKKLAKKPDDDKPVTPPKPDDDQLPPKKVATLDKPDDVDGAAGDKPVKKKKKKKKVASSEDDGGTAEAGVDTGTPVDAAAALSPGGRALDAVLGLSVTMRRMSFAFSPTLLAKPPGYSGTPVAGAMIDATVYPLAIGHKRTDRLKDIGLNVMYDRVLKINSKDPMTGNVFATTEARFAIGGTFRYAFNKTALAPVVLGSFGYSSQAFTITPGTGQKIDIPNVKYSIIEPGIGLRYPVTAKIIANVDAKFMIVTNTGPIQDPMQYGAASVIGFEGALGADYLITPNIFARAAFRFETIGYTFKGTGMQTYARDNMPMTQDISGARDSYIGGMATVGYLY